jgi:NADH-quinone oxidoreductase subunit L
MNELTPQTLLVLVPLLPLVGAVLTVALGRLLGRHAHLPAVAAIAAAFVVAGMLLTGIVKEVGDHAGHGTPAHAVEMTTTLWQWASVPDAAAAGEAGSGGRAFSVPITLRLDPLTACLLVIITGVGLLVAVYSIGYMHGDPGYPRFFALVSAFVFSMSMLVAASNFLLVYVFWEAVGACSYLLIGFWFSKPEAAQAAKKAFLVNRVGDFGLAVATFLIWMTYGTLDFDGVFAATPAAGLVPTAICLLLLLAACGKSAQLPLHVWLPDAMEGPTPASSLIHAATMVTAGVYLVARSAPLFVACPGALTLVSIVGATTALVAALIGTVQNDLKRVLAYSTISQLGYMFASLGTGTLLGFTGAIFHLVTHAFFKALLFMGAGSVMHAMGGVIDMRRFGGLRRVMPITAATFLVGALALAGVAPFAGFFSKDEILAALHARGWPDAHGEHHDAVPGGGHAAAATSFRLASVTPDAAQLAGGSRGSALDGLDRPATWRLLYWMSLVTAALTAFYTFRAVFMTFTGPTRVPEEAGHHAHESPPSMTVPLAILAVLSAVSGWWLFKDHALASFLAATPSFTAPAVAATATAPVFHWDIAVQGTLAALAGIVIAALGHLGRRSDGPQMERFLGPLQTLFANRFFIDQIYAATIVRPLELLAGLAAAVDRYVVDGLVDAVARLPLGIGAVVRHLQSGLVQRYALAGVVGVLLIVLALVARAMG